MNTAAPRRICRALNTRPAGQAAELTRLLELRGFDVRAFPALEIRYTATSELLLAVIARLPDTGWLVFTSANGVTAMQRCGVCPKQRIAVIGESTADALRRLGIKAAFVAKQSNGEALAREFTQFLALEGGVQDTSILLLRGTTAGPVLPDALKRQGLPVEEVVVYESNSPAVSEGEAAAALAFLGVPGAGALPERIAGDCVIFLTSSEAARNLLRIFAAQAQVARSIWEPWILDLPAVAVGPRTAGTARELGFRAVFIAEKPSDECLVATVDRIPQT